MIAMPDEPGTPKNKVGSSDPASLAQLPVSAPMTPATPPLPNRSGSSADCPVWPYAIPPAPPPPRPGMTPLDAPTTGRPSPRHLERAPPLSPRPAVVVVPFS